MKSELKQFMSLAKAYARAERAQQKQPWAIVTIERRTPDNQIIALRRYDLPKKVLDRYRWVILWRSARFQCRYPRDKVFPTSRYYDKPSEQKLGIDAHLSRLRAAKAAITRAKRQAERYVEEQRRCDPDYDEASDPESRRLKEKLQQKQHRYLDALLRLRGAVWRHHFKNEKSGLPPDEPQTSETKKCKL